MLSTTPSHYYNSSGAYRPTYNDFKMTLSLYHSKQHITYDNEDTNHCNIIIRHSISPQHGDIFPERRYFLSLQEVDFGVGNFGIVETRANVVDFSVAFSVDHHVIVMRRTDPSASQTFLCLGPFSNLVWGLVVATVLRESYSKLLY